MAGIRELRGRIKTVGNIKQITRAMEMVATTKLRKFQDRAVASRPYTEEMSGLVGRLARILGPELEKRPVLNPGRGEKVAVLLVSSDRGLCGAYNSNLFRKLESWLAEDRGRDVDYFVYGRKGYQYLTRRGRDVVRLFAEPKLERVDYRAAARTAKDLARAFLEGGQYRTVRILYAAFKSLVKYVPTWIDYLPVEAAALLEDEGEPAGRVLGDVILEPSADEIFDRVLPRYLETRMYNALIEAITSEYASRRMTMKNATDAAGDMQIELKGIYNRKRQEGITKDLLDIVGGVEALR